MIEKEANDLAINMIWKEMENVLIGEEKLHCLYHTKGMAHTRPYGYLILSKIHYNPMFLNMTWKIYITVFHASIKTSAFKEKIMCALLDLCNKKYVIQQEHIPQHCRDRIQGTLSFLKEEEDPFLMGMHEVKKNLYKGEWCLRGQMDLKRIIY